VITFIKDSLAAYRLTRLVVEDVITSELREKIFEKYPPHDKSWSYALTCYHCAGLWTGLVVAVARVAAPRAWDPISNGLAAAAVTGLISERR